jgi:hypothetical protein
MKTRLLLVVLAGILLGAGSLQLYRAVTTPARTTPFFDPPVLAGQWIPGLCSAGVYARLGSAIVLTTSPHCTGPGTVARDPADGTFLGTIGPTARDATCPYPDHTCAASDIDYLVMAAARIPWGHLHLLDFGTAGYRTLTPDTKPLTCADIAIGDAVELDSRGVHRTGYVLEKGEYLKDPALDGSYFPCMIIADAQVGGGDSGGVVLVRGIPAGVVSRSFGGYLGFTPLAEGLAELGITMCTSPDCGLSPG